ncbi:hypothetical protein KQY30_26690 [Streptomyces sp. GMY02]|uniref:hypothetical protein n=1 Tax=Streptomyces sp. GMY02 TaxID=1333528 RepID=UPI001C2B8168|nr:hypothetical protein [Streptomyces sp. GMY02]QXE37273.1 hypothetical protein KQY30_26690 [Streptomyces sp. GMY02]
MSGTERPQRSPGQGTDRADRARRRFSPLAVATVAAAVLIAGGGGAYLATSGAGGESGADGGGGSGTPKGDRGDRNPSPLALDEPAGATEGGAPGIAPGEPDPRGFVYRATGPLPDGPGTARVYRPSNEVTSAEVARLAGALGLAGAPRPDGAYWKVGTDKDGSGPLLQVARQAPGTWTFARFGPATGGDDCVKVASCAGGGPGGTSDSGGTGGSGGSGAGAVSEAVAKKAAAPVLRAAGQGGAALDAGQLMGAVRVVNADPVVGGLPTHGWSTGIQVGADGQVVGGTGQLAAPQEGAAYPVIGADKALEELNRVSGDLRGSGPIVDCATSVPLEKPVDGGRSTDPCAPRTVVDAEPVDIGRAVFGLALRSSGGQGVLVPAWLFEVVPGGGTPPYTLAQTAVAPEFLTKAAPESSPAPEREPGGGLGFTSYGVRGRTLDLRFMGGVCGSYAAVADESGTAVTVRLSHTEPAPGTVCITLAKEQTVSVRLAEPLGGRQVIDRASGERMPRL